MKSLGKAIDLPAGPDDCSQQVLEVIPLVMRAIRADLRDNRSCDLSVPQLRALTFIDHQPAASLSELAGYIGLSLPSMSKMVDGLLGRGLVSRAEDPADRRRVILRLTGDGQARVEAALAATEAALAERLSRLSPEQRATVRAAMTILRPIFAQGPGRGRERQRQAPALAPGDYAGHAEEQVLSWE